MLKSKINQINQFLLDEKYNGSVLIAHQSKIIFDKHYGMADFELDVPVSEKTRFRIASITKIFTAVAIMQLVEKGLIKEDDFINKYIMDYPKGDQITIKHLLTNSSGVGNFDLESDFYNVYNAKSFNDELINLFKNKPLLFKPGEMFSYSISGFFLLGYIIEKVSNLSYEEYLRKHIFEPLKMEDSGMDYYKSILKGRAKPYDKMDNQLKNSDFIDMRVAGAGGGLYSTTKDLFLFFNGLINNQIISKDSFKILWTNQIKINDDTNYGHGMFLAKAEMYGIVRRKYYHTGGGPGVRSIFAYYPDDQMFCVKITNINDSKSFNSVHSKIEELLLQK